MELLTRAKIEAMSIEHKKEFEAILPQIVKRLICVSCENSKRPRFPYGEDIWARGYDGIVECKVDSQYVNSGVSVWEFGTSSDPLEKIESDYKKRTKDPLGLNREETTFYLVTPKIWSYSKSIQEWENTHTDWKEVHVYDASVLCDWINSHPAICAWIFEEILHDSLDFYSVDKAWKILSNKTKPVFSENMFLLNREPYSEKLLSLEDNVIRIKSDYFLDAYGFALLTIKNSLEQKDKYVIVNNSETYKRLIREFPNDRFLLSFNYSEDVSSTATTLLCFNKEATSIHENILLDKRYKSNYIEIFKSMGLDTGKANKLFVSTHGNLNVIIRRIPGLSNVKRPDWADNVNIDYLIPIIILRNFDKNANKEIIEKISGKPISEITDYYDKISAKEDTPVKIIDSQYILISFEESWEILGKAYQRKIANICLNILSDIIRQEEDNHYWATASYSSLKKLVTNLFFDLLQYSIENDFSIEEKDKISKILKTWFFSSNTFVNDNIYLISETVPDLVYEELNITYKQYPDTLMDELGNIHSHLQSCFSVLSYFENTAIKTCQLLFKICQRVQKGNLFNEMIDKLAEILLPWNENSAIDIDGKYRLLNIFVEQNSEISLKLISILLSKNNYYIQSGDADKKHNKKIIYTHEVNDFRANIFKIGIILACSAGASKGFKDIIRNYYYVSPEDLCDLSKKFTSANFTEAELFDINYQIRRLICHINNDAAIYTRALKDWVDVTSFENPVLNNCWAFYDNYDYADIEIGGYYMDIGVEKVEILRKGILEGIYKKFGVYGIINVLNFSSEYFRIGDLLVEVVLPEDIYLLCKGLVGKSKYYLTADIIDCVEKDIAIKILLDINDDERKELLGKIRRIDICEVISEEELSLYWSTKQLNDNSIEHYKDILKHNPFSVIIYALSYVDKDLEHAMTFATLRFSEYISNPGKRQLVNKDILESLINRIDERHYSDDWAILCFEIFKIFKLREFPICVKKLFFVHPEILVKFIEENEIYTVIFNFGLDSTAYEDYDGLLSFVNYLARNGLKSVAGQILGKSGIGDDGCYFKENVRKLLEAMDDEKFDYDVFVGYLNNNSARTISDGQDLLGKIDELKHQISKLIIYYPHTAKIMELITNSLNHEADRDLIYSETSVF